MDLGLRGKIALVTGAGSQTGYGKAIVKTLAEEGCDVAVADIDYKGAKKTVAELETLKRQGLAVKVDVTNRASVDNMVKKVLERFGKIDILINHAGASWGGAFLETTREQWDFDIQVNLYGQMNVAQAVIPYMVKQKYGRVIFTSGGKGLPGLSTYGAAKAAIEALTHSIAAEVAASGVIVNGIGPGLGLTGLTKDADLESPHFQEFIRSSMLKRLCRPEDVGPSVAFLVSDACSYLTGQFFYLRAS
jgi:3-oxoacyl-[acyl-carrier protein] reductase